MKVGEIVQQGEEIVLQEMEMLEVVIGRVPARFGAVLTLHLQSYLNQSAQEVVWSTQHRVTPTNQLLLENCHSCSREKGLKRRRNVLGDERKVERM